MSASVLTRREAAELGEISLGAINKAIEQRVIPVRRVHRRPMLSPESVASLVVLSDIDIPLPIKTKRQISQWVVVLVERGVTKPEVLLLSEALQVRYPSWAREVAQRARRYAELRDKLVEVNPEIRGGEPVIRGSRVPVRGLARQIELGESIKALREDYPHLPKAAFEFAPMWAKANPRRGRPVPPWRNE